VRRRRGFTLIEVLLAATLTALIGLAVGQVVYVTNRAQRRVRERSQRRSLLNVLERRVRDDLRGTLPPGGLYAAGLVGQDQPESTLAGETLLDPELRREAEAKDAPPPIDGRAQLTLAVLPPVPAFGDALPAGQGPAWQVIYRIDDDPETAERGLVRELTRVRDPLEGAEAEPLEVLSPDVVGLSIRYFDGQTQEWAETWNSATSETLPSEVELRLALVEQDEVVELRLTVHPPSARMGQVPEATQ